MLLRVPGCVLRRLKPLQNQDGNEPKHLLHGRLFVETAPDSNDAAAKRIIAAFPIVHSKGQILPASTISFPGRACHRDRHQNCKTLEIKYKAMAERVGFYMNGRNPKEFAVFSFVSSGTIALKHP